MNNLKIVYMLLILSIIVIILAMGIGSVYISPINTLNIFLFNLTGISFFGEVDEVLQVILWQIRFPRAILTFICGSGLAVSGVIMQSVLKNPLASSYTLGVSSGAALGASLVILFNISLFGFLTMQMFGFSFGLLTVFAAVVLAAKIDKNMHDNSIILMGMIFSLFANAMLTIIMALSGEQLQRLIFWQLGSFSMKTWLDTIILLAIVIIGLIMALLYHNEIDILTLGDEQAQISGVNVKKVKWFLLSLGAIITGSIVSVVGIIGFIDLFTPHVSRKIVGASHKYVLLVSALLGGCFMVICDLIARTIMSPIELPVGAITALIGAPFFIYIFFNKRKNNNDNIR